MSDEVQSYSRHAHAILWDHEIIDSWKCITLTVYSVISVERLRLSVRQQGTLKYLAERRLSVRKFWANAGYVGEILRDTSPFISFQTSCNLIFNSNFMFISLPWCLCWDLFVSKLILPWLRPMDGCMLCPRQPRLKRNDVWMTRSVSKFGNIEPIRGATFDIQGSGHGSYLYKKHFTRLMSKKIK